MTAENTEGGMRGPLGQRESERPELSHAYDAVRYLLDRIQTDPDLRYHMLHTQAMALLCAAEASHLGKSWVEVLNLRCEDLQPAYDRREPQLVEARKRIEELESGIGDHEPLAPAPSETCKYVPLPVDPIGKQWWEQ